MKTSVSVPQLMSVQDFPSLWLEVRVLENEALRKPFNAWAEGRLSRDEPLRKDGCEGNEPAAFCAMGSPCV